MAAASPKSPAVSSPHRASTINANASNNSSQMSGVFGKCSEPIPTTTKSVRQQQQAAQRAKTSIGTDSANKFIADDGFSSNKTVSKPACNTAFKKKAGSVPMPEVNIFSPPADVPHKVRTTQQHTDPFSEARVRAEIKMRKLLVPESTTKAPKACSIRVSESTKAKWESPYAADDFTTTIGGGPIDATNGASPSPSSPTRSSHANSPMMSTKRCTRTQEAGHGIFSSPTDSELTASRAQSHANQQNGSRYKHSNQGLATMNTELTETEMSKERNHHKRTVHPPQTTMEGVFTVIEKKNRHPNYKIHAPFARQGSIAASARIGGRRHKKNSDSATRGEVVSPYANNVEAPSPSASAASADVPAEITPSRSRKVFTDKHSSKTPFARVNSLPPTKTANYSRRVYKQQATSPFAIDE